MNLFNRLFRSREKPKNYRGGLSFLFGDTTAGQTVNEKTSMQLIVEHDSEAKGLSISDILSHRVEILALIYNIDKEQIEDGVEVSDVLPAYNEAAMGILSLVFEKLEKIPNDGAGTEGK